MNVAYFASYDVYFVIQLHVIFLSCRKKIRFINNKFFCANLQASQFSGRAHKSESDFNIIPWSLFELEMGQ